MSESLYLLEPSRSRFVVPVAGATNVLTVDIRKARCGHIDDGLVFQFGDEGGWVVELESLRAIVRLAEAWREKAAIAKAEGRNET